MTSSYQIPPIITRNFKTILFFLAFITFCVYVYLILIATKRWTPIDSLNWLSINGLSFELSHVPLHFFAIFLTTAIIIGLYETLEKSIKKYDQNQPRILRYFPNAERSFKAMGISLKDIHENNEVFRNTMERFIGKAKTNLDVKFLLLAPDSKCIRKREVEEDGFESGRLVGESEKTIKALTLVKDSSEIAKNNHSLKFYTYDRVPRDSVIIVDDKLVNVVPYLYKRKGSETEGFESKDPEIVRQYVEEFNLIWKEIEQEKT
jgi:hypothetical protein